VSVATPDVLELPLWIDLTAVVAGALAGAVFAVRERLDVIGVLSIAVVMGLGGGIVRDLLLSVRPVALTNPAYLPTAFAAALVGLVLAPLVRRMTHVFTLLDGISLGLFTVVGVEKGLLFDLPRTSAVVVGVAAACGGSVLRDLLSGHPPEIVRRGPWNATAAAAGAIAYCLLSVAGAPIGWCETVTIVLTTGLRLLSVYRGWETPLPRDLAPSLTRPLRANREALRPWRRPSPADPPDPDDPPAPASGAP
jgi:uncharacterized membrane protein YeiH